MDKPVTQKQKKVDPRVLKLRDLLVAHRMTNRALAVDIGESPCTISNLMRGDYVMCNLQLIVKIANYFGVAINEVYDTGCIKDNNDRTKIQIMNGILNDVRTLNKLKNKFSKTEKLYLTEMLKGKTLNEPKMPKYYLINVILEADYYSDIQVKLGIKAQDLCDKIDELEEIEAFVLLDRIFNFNNNKETSIEKLFY